MGTNQSDWTTSAAQTGQIVHRPQSIGQEDIHIRSYDHQWAYDVDIEVIDESGAVVFTNRYYLQPGHTRSLGDVVPEGRYEVIVTLDNSLRRSIQCRIGETPDQTAVIEIGNGAASLTAGHNR